MILGGEIWGSTPAHAFPGFNSAFDIIKKAVLCLILSNLKFPYTTC